MKLNILLSIILCLLLLTSGATVQVFADSVRGGTLWVEDALGCNGETISVSVSMSNPDNPVDAFGFDLQFDSTMLTFLSCQTGELTLTWEFLVCNQYQPGRLRIGGYSPVAITPGHSGRIVILWFRVTCPSCGLGQTSALTLSDLEDDVIGYTATDGTFEYYCPPTPTPTATRTLSPTPYYSPTRTITPTSTPTDDEIWVADSAGATGQLIQIPVSINNPDTSVDAFGFDVQYCQQMLHFVSCQPGELTADWYQVNCNEYQTGRIRIGGYNSSNAIPAGSNGSVIVLTFMVECQACNDEDQCVLSILNLEDDFYRWTTGAGVFTFMDNVISVEDSSGSTGQLVNIDITIDNPSMPLDAFGFDLSYCPDMLSYQSYALAPLVADWEAVGCFNYSPGHIRIGGYNSEPPIAINTRGAIITLTFRVTCSSCTPGDTCQLIINGLEDDLITWTAKSGTYTFTGGTPVPSPTVSPAPTDTLTPTAIPTSVPTDTPTLTPTFSPTDSPTLNPTYSPTESPVPTATSTHEPTATNTPPPTFTPTITLTPTPAETSTPVPTVTITLTPTISVVPTPPAIPVQNSVGVGLLLILISAGLIASRRFDSGEE